MSTTAVLNLGINTKQFSHGLKGASASLGKFTKFTAAGFALVGGAAAVGLAAVSWSLIKTAADAEETENKFNSVFSGLQTSANETAKALAKAYGFSSRESQKLLGDTGDLLTGFGFTQKAALGLSKQVQELASDLTSFQNFEGGVEGASRAITKALLGEAESMKTLGVVVQQNTKEYRDNVAQVMKLTGVTERQAKTQVIFAQIMEQSKNALGDYSKTSKMFANQLKLTGKIWDNLKVGVGAFIKDILGAESGLLAFNDTFKTVTDNTLGFLSNWRENFKTTFDWILRNAATLLSHDIPILFANLASYTGEVMAVIAKTMTDAFVIISAEILKIWNKMWAEDMPNGMLKGLDEIGEKFKERIKTIFDPRAILVDFAIESAIGVLRGREKTAAEKLFSSVKGNLAKLRAPTDLLKDIDFKSDDMELNLTINDKYKKDLEEASKAIDGSDGVLGKGGKSGKSGRVQPQQLESAVLKGSIQAFKEENTIAGKIQSEQLKELRKQSRYSERIANNQITVNEVSI